MFYEMAEEQLHDVLASIEINIKLTRGFDYQIKQITKDMMREYILENFPIINMSHIDFDDYIDEDVNKAIREVFDNDDNLMGISPIYAEENIVDISDNIKAFIGEAVRIIENYYFGISGALQNGCVDINGIRSYFAESLCSKNNFYFPPDILQLEGSIQERAYDAAQFFTIKRRIILIMPKAVWFVAY